MNYAAFASAHDTDHASRSLAPAPSVTEHLAALERDGFVIIRGALAADDVALIRARIEHARAMGWEEGLNEVGNMWFDSLLEREPDHFKRLVAHSSVRPILDALYGRQCQLRSLRAHLNPGAYRQEWHMDFYGYWEERDAAASRPLALAPTGVNTTFYLQDNLPGRGRLTFIPGSHRSEPAPLRPYDYAAFQAWSEQQPRVDLHPLAGDCVVFYSHMVHRGAKDDATIERSNVVCHYQPCVMHESVWHVAPPREFVGSCPLARA